SSVRSTGQLRADSLQSSPSTAPKNELLVSFDPVVAGRSRTQTPGVGEVLLELPLVDQLGASNDRGSCESLEAQ
ncbi:MAG: hypothetical protein ACI835_005860, partial [Planctomycetota bacterium]